jgi:hypothetical protein
VNFDVIRITAKAGTTGTTSYTHGLGETPKLALFLIPSGNYDDADEDSVLSNMGQIAFGACDGTRQWCAFAGDEDGGTSQVAQRAFHSDCCIVTYDVSAGTVIFKASFSSWSSSNLILNWSVVGGAGNTTAIYVVLLSGADFNVRVDNSTMRTTTGTQDYTGVSDGKALITCNLGAVTTLNTFTANAGFSLGFADESGNARVRSFFSQDATTTNAFYSDTGAALVANNSAGALAARAAFTSHNPGGAVTFRLQWITAAADAYRFGYVHLGGAGLRASAGHFTTAPNNTITTTGNKPRVVLYTGNGVSTLNTGTVDDVMYSIGVGENVPGTENAVGLNINSAGGTNSGGALLFRALFHCLNGGTTEENGLGQLSNSDTAESFNTVKSGSGADFVPFYLALGISPFTLVQKALSGSSADSGVLTKQQTVHSALSGASGNTGNLSSRALDVINSLLAGVSGCAGALSGLALHPVTLGGVSANAGALVKLVKRSLTGSAVDQGVLGRATSFRRNGA